MWFKYLGSLSFAILLIVSTVVFVIVGTLLEACTQSHAFAAWLTYQNPIFQLLFWLYFINIFFSALSRYPFQTKHIPFLLTHAGLLLLLLGIFFKNHFGVQGACALAEGSSTRHIFLPNTYALHIENKKNHCCIPIKKGHLGQMNSGIKDLELTLLEWIPHAEERLEGFIKGNWVHVIDLPLIELKTLGNGPSIQTQEYDIYAHQANPKQISFPGRPSLFFIQDDSQQDHLVAYNKLGECFHQPLTAQAYLVYNKGYGGYATFADLPTHFPQMSLIAPLTRKWKMLPTPKKREEATPRIRVLASSGGKREVFSLCYDKYGQNFKWPILEGKYLTRLQSEKKELPLQLRLRRAQQINYPETERPYSYEATLLFENEEQILSMNHVYEKNGYRFYLANLLTLPSGIKHVQIVVNYDPTKYLLIYPGAIILASGIILLYFQKRYV